MMQFFRRRTTSEPVADHWHLLTERKYFGWFATQADTQDTSSRFFAAGLSVRSLPCYDQACRHTSYHCTDSCRHAA